MLNIGTTVRQVSNDPSKGRANIDSTYQQLSAGHLPAGDDLQSALGADTLTLAEHLEFLTPPDILLEDELCWPVKPDLDY